MCVSVCGFRGMSQVEKPRFLPLSLSHMDLGHQGGGAFAARAPTRDRVPRLSVLLPGRGRLRCACSHQEEGSFAECAPRAVQELAVLIRLDFDP